ncbi:MAG TPA: hypothetical protein VD926_04945 [Acidimicrobiales bacterium]|nr:hypothetical protein [Acidimicrobiales bacterium]
MLLVAAACAGDGDLEEAELRVRLVTRDELIGGNVDDDACEWGSLRYELTDADRDEVVDRGALDGGGTILGLTPYECAAAATITAPAVDAYELTVSGESVRQVTWSVTETFARDELESGVDVMVPS